MVRGNRSTRRRLSHCHSDQDKFRMTWPVIESGPLRGIYFVLHNSREMQSTRFTDKIRSTPLHKPLTSTLTCTGVLIYEECPEMHWHFLCYFPSKISLTLINLITKVLRSCFLLRQLFRSTLHFRTVLIQIVFIVSGHCSLNPSQATVLSLGHPGYIKYWQRLKVSRNI
jgi:hypothetical protein